MHRFGLHIRLINSFTDTIKQAIKLKLPYFQTFAILPSGKSIELDKSDTKSFLELKNKYFKNLYLHGSYWINLCRSNQENLKIIKRELDIAGKLNFTHFIIHPGAPNNDKTKAEGIVILAKALNKLCKEVLTKKNNLNNIKIVLENTTHGNLTIGSDFNDFKKLLKLLKYPEKISFCIDTSHAYAYGYNLASSSGQDDFIDLLNNTIGLDKIDLIHFNDTCEKLGKKIDRHAIPGAGNIGKNYLKQFILNKNINNIPAILELPLNSENKETEILNQLDSWFK